jgi:hypothetical protein
VIELPDRSVTRSVRFDTGRAEFEGRLAKRMLVEMSPPRTGGSSW